MALRAIMAALAFAGLSSGLATAATQTTEWIDTVAAERTAGEMRDKKMRLIGLDCRADDAGMATAFSMV